MEANNGLTYDGAEVQYTIDPDKGIADVEYNNTGLYLKFSFNPDFPQDVKAFFEAFCNIRSIEIEGA
jgi:hypothetical protein